MKKNKFVFLLAILASSSAMAADNISSTNNNYVDSPFSLRLEGGYVFRNQVKDHFFEEKLKSKPSAFLAINFGYDIDRDFNVGLELGALLFKDTLNKTGILSQFNKIYNNAKQAGSIVTGNEKISIGVTQNTNVYTAMINANYNFYRDDNVTLSAGIEIGASSKIIYYNNRLLEVSSNIEDKYSFKSKSALLSAAYGAKFATRYDFLDNASVHLSYNFKNLGAGKFKMIDDHSLSDNKVLFKYKFKNPIVHLIGVGISYRF